MSKRKKWKLLDRKLVYDGSPYIEIYKDKIILPSNEIIEDYHKIKVNNAVMLLIQDSKKKLMIYEEYRHGIGKVSYTFPAGGIEKGETVYKASKRELLEETGFSAKKSNIVKKYIVSGSYKFSELYYVSMHELEKISNPIKKDMENPNIIWLSKTQVRDAVNKNKFLGLTYATGALLWLTGMCR